MAREKDGTRLQMEPPGGEQLRTQAHELPWIIIKLMHDSPRPSTPVRARRLICPKTTELRLRAYAPVRLCAPDPQLDVATPTKVNSQVSISCVCARVCVSV